MKIGKIISINFNQFKVKIFSEITGGSVNINGEIYYFGNIGSYLKTVNAIGENIICEVVSIFDSDFISFCLSKYSFFIFSSILIDK